MSLSKVKPSKFDYKKIKKILQVSYAIFLIIYTIIMIALSSYGLSSLTENSELLNELNENWGSSPIVDMVITTTRQCPSQYQESLVQWDFSGFAEGCNCNNATSSSNTRQSFSQGVSLGACSLAQIRAGCTLIPSIKDFELTFWGDTSTSSKICIKRDTSYNFINTYELSQNKACPTGYKACVSTQQTSNHFCVKQDSSCPITGLQINSYSCDPSDLNCQDLNTKFNQEKSMSILTTNDSLPVVEFAINEYAMCSVKSQQNIYPERTDYILRNKARATCGSEGNVFWNLGVIDSMKESDFYGLNGIQTLVQTEPNISTYLIAGSTSDALDSDYNVYARTYVKWNTQCSSYFKELVEKNGSLGQLRPLQGSLIAFIVISGLFTGILLPLRLIFKVTKRKPVLCHKKCSDLLFNYKPSKRSRSMHALKLLPLPLLIGAVAVTTSTKNFYQMIGENQCSEPAWNEVFMQISQELTQVHLCDSILLGLFFLLVLLDVSIEVRARRRKHQKKQKDISTKVVPMVSNVRIPVDPVLTPTSFSKGIMYIDSSPVSAELRSPTTRVFSSTLSP